MEKCRCVFYRITWLVHPHKRGELDDYPHTDKCLKGIHLPGEAAICTDNVSTHVENRRDFCSMYSIIILLRLR